MSSQPVSGLPSSHERMIVLTATISHSTISLSRPLNEPITLTLSICLVDSAEPITILTSGSAFDATRYRSGSSPFGLRDATGKLVPASVLHIFRGSVDHAITINPDSDHLLTLYPGTPTQMKLRIGIDEDRVRDGSTRKYLCATCFEQLEAGQRYRIDWCPNGQFNIPLWWWSVGTKESIVKEHVSLWNRVLGKRSFSVNTNLRRDFGITMKQGPEILIEE